MNNIINKCEKCSMDAEYREVVDNLVHNYCVHHKTAQSIKIENIPKKSIFTKIKDLAPLFSIILGISLLAGIRQVGNIDGMLYMMDWMGLFLLSFGMLKLVDLEGFAIGFASYDIIAKRFKHYGYVFPFIEIVLGILYLVGFMFILQNVLVLIISALGMYSAYKVITDKLEIRCVCLGTLFHIPMTWATFIENFLMAVMIILMLNLMLNM